MLIISTRLILLILLIVNIHNGYSKNKYQNVSNIKKHEVQKNKALRTEEEKRLQRYIASVRKRTYDIIFGDEHLCGGCIISPKLIITSAICLVKNNTVYAHTDLSIVVGSPNRLKYTKNTERLLVEEVIVHPEYTDENLNWNIGLIKLYKNIRINDRTAAVAKLPTSNVQEGITLYLVGWGRYYKHGPTPGQLVYADINVIKTKECKDSRINLGDNEACATDSEVGHLETCVGYIGGTAIQIDKFVGIVEYSPVCVNIVNPVRFLNIYKLTEWILKNSAMEISISVNLLLYYVINYIFLYHLK